MTRLRFIGTFCAIFLLAITSTFAGPTLRVAELRCEHLENPLGIDTERPRLSWKLESNERSQRQTAYQVLCASSERALRSGNFDLWDSGRMQSEDSVEVWYGGRELSSRQPCFWKVRVWNKDGQMSESTVARWEMGFLKDSDWQAKWIARTTDTNDLVAPLLRKTFSSKGKIRQARAYISGLGYFELYLNGKRVGDHVLDPGYTRYDRRVLYVTHDVTELLKRGDNAVGIILGNGWLNVPNRAAWNFDRVAWRSAPKVICQLEIEYTDGRRSVINTDESWRTAESPIEYNTIYSGEIYDARRELADWNKVSFKDSTWNAALVVAPPAGKLTAQMMPPIRATKTLPAIEITEPEPGVFIVDFGQNLAGHARLNVKGPAGTKVSMLYSERIGTNGLTDRKEIARHVLKYGPDQIFQTDTYILKGGKRETWNSRFTYHGFRYIEVHGFPGKPTTDNFEAVFLHSDVPQTGWFECSNPMLNKILEAARWSYLGNLHGIPTDCPHREKNGWTGDAHIAAEQAMFNYFPSAVYSKWINDIADEQRDDGKLPGIIPTSGWGYTWGNGPAWDSALILIPHYRHIYYGDSTDFRRHYENMKRYVDYLSGRATNHIVSIGLNDWVPFKTKTEAGITDTAYYYVNTRIVAQAARYLDEHQDARRYGNLARDIRRAFNEKFYQPETGLYDNGSQTALSCALYQGLVDRENRARVTSNLVAAVERENWHIDTGILGAKYLLNALTENGRTDVAYRIAAQKDLPGWGWWIEQGATTLWENWNGEDSRNHIMFGDIAAWFYKALAGINPDPNAPGFKHFFIKPHVVGDLTWAKADYNSIRGLIRSDWKVTDGEFRIRVKIPANTSATLSLPIANRNEVKEGGEAVNDARGIRFLRAASGRTEFRVESGDYEFSGPLAAFVAENETAR